MTSAHSVAEAVADGRAVRRVADGADRAQPPDPGGRAPRTRVPPRRGRHLDALQVAQSGHAQHAAQVRHAPGRRRRSVRLDNTSRQAALAQFGTGTVLMLSAI